MRWLKRAGRSPLPDDLPQLPELFGRYELDPHTSGIDGSETWPTCVAPFAAYARIDRDRFLADLSTQVD